MHNEKKLSLNYAYYSACRMYYNQSCDVCHVTSFLFCILKNFIEYICLIYSTMMWKHVGCLELKNYGLFCRKCIITLWHLSQGMVCLHNLLQSLKVWITHANQSDCSRDACLFPFALLTLKHYEYSFGE